jgi:hypothetical protein
LLKTPLRESKTLMGGLEYTVPAVVSLGLTDKEQVLRKISAWSRLVSGTPGTNSEKSQETLLPVSIGGALGEALGRTLGELLGVALGETLGEALGETVGAALGVALGVGLGSGLGAALGAADGE